MLCQKATHTILTEGSACSECLRGGCSSRSAAETLSDNQLLTHHFTRIV